MGRGDINRQIKNSVASSDNRVPIELVRNAKPRADVVPGIKGAAAWVLRAAYQIIRTFQIWQSGRGPDWAGFGRIKSNDAIKALRPVPLSVDAKSESQGDFTGDLVGVAGIERLIKILFGRFRGLRRVAVSAIRLPHSCE